MNSEHIKEIAAVAKATDKTGLDAYVYEALRQFYGTNYYEYAINFFLGLHAPFPGVLRASSINSCCETSIWPSLTHAGISCKDQTLDGADLKKGDRVFLDTEIANVDVCLFLLAFSQ